MKQGTDSKSEEHGVCPVLVSFLSLLPLLSGCAPTLDVGGVYFPGWLVSTVVGVLAAYGILLALGRSERARPLADSGLFFVSMVVGIALAVWWVCFSGF